jgi:hypothetical protein
VVVAQLILNPAESSAVYCAMRATHSVVGRVDLTLDRGTICTRVFEYPNGRIRVWRSEGDRSDCENYAGHLDYAAAYGLDPTFPFQVLPLFPPQPSVTHEHSEVLECSRS